MERLEDHPELRWLAPPYKVNNQFTPYAGLIYDINKTLRPTPATRSSSRKTRATRPARSCRPSTARATGRPESRLSGRQAECVRCAIQTQQNNLAQTIPGSSVQRFPNMQASRAVSGARSRSIDLRPAARLAPGWNLSASYTHFTARDADGKPINTSHPRSLFKLYTTYRLPGDLHRSPWAAAWTGRAACTNPPPARARRGRGTRRLRAGQPDGQIRFQQAGVRHPEREQPVRPQVLRPDRLLQPGLVGRAAQRHADAARAILIEGSKAGCVFFPQHGGRRRDEARRPAVRARAGRLRPAGRQQRATPGAGGHIAAPAPIPPPLSR